MKLWHRNMFPNLRYHTYWFVDGYLFPLLLYLIQRDEKCTKHLILLKLFTWIIFGKKYTSCSSSLGSFLHCPRTSPLLDPNIFLSTPFLNTPSIRDESLVVYELYTHIQQQTKCCSADFNIYICGKKRRQKIHDRMSPISPWGQTALNFILNIILNS